MRKNLDENENIDLQQFLIFARDGTPKGIDHNAVFEYIRDNNRLCVYGGVIWYYSGGIFKADVSGVFIKDKIRRLIVKNFRRTNTINQIYGLFFMDSDLVIDRFNKYPKSWVCFKNCMYDAKNRKIMEHNPDYYAVNQIPWDYEPENKTSGESVEKFFHDGMSAEDARTTWQILGLCCVPDNSFQKAVILQGCGGTGKTTLLNLQTSLIGKDNVSSVPLQNLEERFSGIQLLGKLANVCGDLDKAALKTVATFKKIVGGDALTDCYKGKDLVTFIPYARLVFSANEIPITLDEKSNAFFRRLIIIKMDNKPAVPDYQLEEKLIAEMPYIINKSMDALHQLYEDGLIFESNSSKNLVNQLYEESDSVKAFLNEKTAKVTGADIRTTELYQAYKDFCEDEEREALSRNNFYRNIKGKGIVRKTVNGYEKFGDIGWKDLTQNTPENSTEGGFFELDLETELPFE